MEKYYRVIKDTFMWSEGAIISDKKNKGEFTPIQDCWNKVENQNEYISANLIEKNPEWFERVYPDTIKGNIYRTGNQLKELYKKSFINE